MDNLFSPSVYQSVRVLLKSVLIFRPPDSFYTRAWKPSATQDICELSPTAPFRGPLAGWYPLSGFDKRAPVFEADSSVEPIPSSTTHTTSFPSSASRIQSKMFIPSFAAIVLVFPALAGATSIYHPNTNNAITGTGTNGVRPAAGNLAPTTINQCNTGTLQCCDSVQSVSHFSTVLCQPHFLTVYIHSQSDSSNVSSLLESFGVTGVGPNILVGSAYFFPFFAILSACSFPYDY